MLPLGYADIHHQSFLKAFNYVIDIYIVEHYDINNQDFIWEYFSLQRLMETFSLNQSELEDNIMFCNIVLTNEYIKYKNSDFYLCKYITKFKINNSMIRVIGRSSSFKYLIEKISNEHFSPSSVTYDIVDLETLVDLHQSLSLS